MIDLEKRGLDAAQRRWLLARFLERRTQIMQAGVWIQDDLVDELQVIEHGIAWMKSTLPDETNAATHVATSENVS